MYRVQASTVLTSQFKLKWLKINVKKRKKEWRRKSTYEAGIYYSLLE